MAVPSSFRPATGSIPPQPGVYRFRDGRGRVIYVGKAKNLRSRLTSYFQDPANLHARTATMVTTAAGVDWTVVNTEVEALQLEYSWIKEFDPRFNVKYRDDKSYPWLAVTVGEEFPRVTVGRGAKRRGTRYFGPYCHAWAIRETVDLLLRVFPMRCCSNGVFKRSAQIGRPCLLGYIGKCSAPCVGSVSAEDHRAIVDDFCDFMAGQTRPFVKRLEREMYAASERQDYERAARLRDDIGALNRALEKQAVVLGDGTDADVDRARPRTRSRSRCRSSTSAAAGSAASAAGWPTRSRRPTPPGWSSDFLLQLYDGGAADAIPREVLVPALPPDTSSRSSSARRPPGEPGVDPGAAARRQEGAAGDRGRNALAGAGAAQDQAGQRPHHPQPGAGGDPGAPSSLRRRRCASSATTSPTSRAPRSSARWWSSRTAWPARASTAAS